MEGRRETAGGILLTDKVRKVLLGAERGRVKSQGRLKLRRPLLAARGTDLHLTVTTLYEERTDKWQLEEAPHLV